MKALITGAGGFLGGAIAKALREKAWQVNCLQRGDYPELESIGCKNFQGSITNLDTVLNAAEGTDVVFHVAAKAGVGGNYQSYYQPNVVGTQNVVAACKRLGIPKLIYTSSPSVVFDGHDESGINESAPYPLYHLAHYSKTKAIAEQWALNAIDKNFSCTALRPHLIWGPGDQHLLPRIIDRVKAGRLKFVGDGQNKIDSTYIDNAVEAHLLAADKLTPDAACNGKAYFISNDDAMAAKELINQLIKCAGLSPVDKHISPKIAYVVGTLLEAIYGALHVTSEPIMTRFVAKQLSTEHWFDLTAAKNDLGYQASISNEEGFKRLAAALGNEQEN